MGPGRTGLIFLPFVMAVRMMPKLLTFVVLLILATACGGSGVPADPGADALRDVAVVDVSADPGQQDSVVRDTVPAEVADATDVSADTADAVPVDSMDDGADFMTDTLVDDAADVGVDSMTADAAQDVVVDQCPAFNAPIVQGTLAETPLDEISGLIASRRHAGVLWGHNDSGDTPRIWAIQVPAEGVGPEVQLPVVEFTVNKAMDGWPEPFPTWASTAVDWEDIAIGPFAGVEGDAIFIADTGDNSFESADKRRLSVRVYVMPEPVEIVAGDITGVTWFDITYDDGYHDSEAFFVDPLTGDMYLVEKQHHGGPAGVYRVAASDMAGQSAGTDLVAIRVAMIDVELATAADMSADGTMLAIRNYGGAPDGVENNGLLWTRTAGTTVTDMLAGQGCSLPNFPAEPWLEIQGESIAFNTDNTGFFTVCEFNSFLCPLQNLNFWKLDR